MDFYTLYQNPSVFKREDTYLQFNVPNHSGPSRLKAFQKNHVEEHRSLLPVFKSPGDASRFRKEVIYLSAMFRWEVNDTFPIDEGMNHLSITADLFHLPEPHSADCVPLDLNDMDTILSLCLCANFGFFVIGSYHVVSNVLTVSGVVVDPSLENHFNDNEHLNVLKHTYERIYLKSLT